MWMHLVKHEKSVHIYALSNALTHIYIYIYMCTDSYMHTYICTFQKVRNEVEDSHISTRAKTSTHWGDHLPPTEHTLTRDKPTIINRKGSSCSRQLRRLIQFINNWSNITKYEVDAVFSNQKLKTQTDEREFQSQLRRVRRMTFRRQADKMSNATRGAIQSIALSETSGSVVAKHGSSSV